MNLNKTILLSFALLTMISCKHNKINNINEEYVNPTALRNISDQCFKEKISDMIEECENKEGLVFIFSKGRRFICSTNLADPGVLVIEGEVDPLVLKLSKMKLLCSLEDSEAYYNKLYFRPLES